MNILVIDTASHLCAACIYDAAAGRELGRAVRDIGKGHAEQLMAVIGEALAQAGMAYADIGAIAVCVGPGSFTGIRVGVSAARGLALGLGVKSSGVTTLAGLALEARDRFAGRRVLAALDAKRDEIYAALFDELGVETVAPRIVSLDEAVALARPDTVLCGTAASMIAGRLGGGREVTAETATADIVAYARMAAAQGFGGERPKPLYLRGADAKPQAGFVLPRAS